MELSFMNHFFVALICLVTMSASAANTEKVYVGFDNRYVDQLSAFPSLRQKCGGSKPCALRGLILRKSFDKQSLYSSTFSEGRGASPQLYHDHAFVLDTAVHTNPLALASENSWKLNVMGREIHDGDYVQVTYDKLQTISSGGLVYGYVNQIKAIDVIYPNPRLQCVSAVQANGSMFYLETDSGQYLATYGPSTFVRVNTCNVRSQGYCSDTFATGAFLAGDLNVQSPLSVTTSVENYELNTNYFRNLLIEANSKENYWANFSGGKWKTDLALHLSSDQTLSEFPLAARIGSDNATAVAESNRHAPNAKLAWTYSGTNLQPAQGSVDLYCTRWN
jgi:hypothetical protein